ncbi:hypothetical protein TNCV_4197761 [Trichonephila clavipes]|nr:hypothetical protein TNCV_4197761 [Trichonephila clavipes]
MFCLTVAPPFSSNNTQLKSPVIVPRKLERSRNILWARCKEAEKGGEGKKGHNLRLYPVREDDWERK